MWYYGLFVWYYIWLDMCVHMFVYGCKLTLNIYVRVYSNKGLDISACVYWVYVWSMYFEHEPLIHFSQSRWRWSDKAEQQLKTSNLSSHILGCPRDISSGNIFMSNLWVVQGPKVGNIHPCIYTSVVRDSEESWSEESISLFVRKSDWS